MVTTEHSPAKQRPAIDAVLAGVFAQFPQITLAVLFGSMASGKQRGDSDVDIAVSATHALSVDEKIALTSMIAERTGRVVDLIDLRTATEPLLGQVLRHGRMILGSETSYGDLINRHLLEQADFMPYRNRILAERRMTWIGK